MEFHIDIDTKELLEGPLDLNVWEMDEKEQKIIFYVYEIDKPAKIENQLIQEYPNGGKDYAEIIIEPEEGHFEVKTEDGEDFPYHVDIPEGISKDEPVPDLIDMTYWRKRTPNEIAEKKEEQEKQEAEYKELQEKAEAQQAFLESAPSELKEVKDAQDDIVLMLADIVGGAV